ncbi:MAG: DnaB-like helicase C-terminal domain-containing protein [Butyrivibrio sp.]|nr:DnaB-like helicase C-terminal domain-containing protein [Butyrivibrio sp.]
MNIYETKKRSIDAAFEAITGKQYKRVTETHFAGLDVILRRGFRKGQLIIVGGRPSMGKTAFAIGLVKQIAVEHGQPVVYFSLEGSAQRLMERILVLESGVNIENGESLLMQEELDVIKAAERLDAAPLVIDDQPYAGFEYIRDRCKNEFTDNVTPGLIIIDYLQLMDAYSDEGVTDLLKKLKGLAEELQCPIMVLSQLDRNVDAREDHRPTLKDIRGVDDAESLADVIMFLYRDAYYDPHPEDKDKAEIIIAKNIKEINEIGTITVKFRDGHFRNCYNF